MVGPLIALAIPSVLIGALTYEFLLFKGGFGTSIVYSPENQEAVREIGESVGNWWHFGLHAISNPVFWIMALGVFAAWALYIKWTDLPGRIDAKLKPLRWILERKYGFDWFNENVLAKASRGLGWAFLEGRRRRHHRYRRDRRHHGLHRPARGHRAPRAERFPVFIRVLDGHRPRGHALLVRDAPDLTSLNQEERNSWGLDCFRF